MKAEIAAKGVDLGVLEEVPAEVIEEAAAESAAAEAVVAEAAAE